MNNGIIISGKGNIGVAQVVSGEGNNVTTNQDGNVTLTQGVDSAEKINSLKNLLDELKSELSEHKSSLDKLSSKVSIIDAELEEENPNNEKITKHKKDLLSTTHQFTGTINNLHNIIEMLQPYLTH